MWRGLRGFLEGHLLEGRRPLIRGTSLVTSSAFIFRTVSSPVASRTLSPALVVVISIVNVLIIIILLILSVVPITSVLPLRGEAPLHLLSIHRTVVVALLLRLIGLLFWWGLLRSGELGVDPLNIDHNIVQVQIDLAQRVHDGLVL